MVGSHPKDPPSIILSHGAICLKCSIQTKFQDYSRLNFCKNRLQYFYHDGDINIWIDNSQQWHTCFCFQSSSISFASFFLFSLCSFSLLLLFLFRLFEVKVR